MKTGLLILAAVIGVSIYVQETGWTFDFKNDQTAAVAEAPSESDYNNEAVWLCERSIKAQLNNPLSFDKHWTTQKIWDKNQNGLGRNVSFNFEAKNGFGNSLTRKAYCVVEDNKNVTAVIGNG